MVLEEPESAGNEPMTSEDNNYLSYPLDLSVFFIVAILVKNFIVILSSISLLVHITNMLN